MGPPNRAELGRIQCRKIEEVMKTKVKPGDVIIITYGTDDYSQKPEIPDMGHVNVRDMFGCRGDYQAERATAFTDTCLYDRAFSHIRYSFRRYSFRYRYYPFHILLFFHIRILDKVLGSEAAKHIQAYTIFIGPPFSTDR